MTKNDKSVSGRGYRSGRPATHDEPWSKVTVVLLNRQVASLDQLSVNIRSKTGAAIRRAEIIRALVDGLLESGIDVTSVETEAELKNRLLTVFRQ